MSYQSKIKIELIDKDPSEIYYQFVPSLFGEILIASTDKGICYLGFSDNHVRAFEELRKKYPLSDLVQTCDEFQKKALTALFRPSAFCLPIELNIKSTSFQYKVWSALLDTQPGVWYSYSDIAKCIGCNKAARAVGNAVGANPVAFFIPCHRIKRNDALGGYRWGSERKLKIMNWEQQLIK